MADMSTDAVLKHAESVGEGCSVHGHHHGYLETKDAYLSRLRRIEGQVRGIARMVEDEKYCIDILTQISAVNSALKSVALLLVDDHLNHCVKEAIEEGGEVSEAKIAEASAAIARLVKS